MVVALALHILAAVAWVGGMLFAHQMLRPAARALEPGTRLPLWHRVFSRFFPLVWLGHRTTYIFYFLAALPAVAVGIAQLLRQARLSAVVMWGYLVVAVIAFADYYPFRRVW